MNVPDEQIARVAGFDGLAYIKFLGLCFRISAGVMYALPHRNSAQRFVQLVSAR